MEKQGQVLVTNAEAGSGLAQPLLPHHLYSMFYNQAILL